MDDYYKNQAGTGIGGFAGQRYQKGDGFFGRLISGSVLPIIRKVLPYLGKTALNTGVNILSDVASGDSVRSSAKRRLQETGRKVGEKAMAKVKEITGSGKRKRTSKRTVKKKPARKPASKRASKKRVKKARDFL